MIAFKLASEAHDFKTAEYLFKEYALELNIDLGFQNFEQELADIKNIYTGIFLCYDNETAIGCAAIRNKLDDKTCELKRMYIKASYRGQKLGESLLHECIKLARSAGYHRMVLDTLDTLTGALALYKKFGFRPILPYYYNPHPNTVFMELRL